MKSSSGEKNIYASGSIQSLTQADNIARQKADARNEQNRGNAGGMIQTKKINGQTFYLTDDTWTDMGIVQIKSPRVRKIKSGSDTRRDSGDTESGEKVTGERFRIPHESICKRTAIASYRTDDQAGFWSTNYVNKKPLVKPCVQIFGIRPEFISSFHR
jgi:hypothetical protein